MRERVESIVVKVWKQERKRSKGEVHMSEDVVYCAEKNVRTPMIVKNVYGTTKN